MRHYLLLVLLRVGQPPPELRVPPFRLADPLPHPGVLRVAPLVGRPALLQLHPRLLMLDLSTKRWRGAEVSKKIFNITLMREKTRQRVNCEPKSPRAARGQHLDRGTVLEKCQYHEFIN